MFFIPYFGNETYKHFLRTIRLNPQQYDFIDKFFGIIVTSYYNFNSFHNNSI